MAGASRRGLVGGAHWVTSQHPGCGRDTGPQKSLWTKGRAGQSPCRRPPSSALQGRPAQPAGRPARPAPPPAHGPLGEAHVLL